MSVDIDEIYRDADRRDGDEILDKWARDFRFQFQVKHLLIATAVLAIALTLWRLELLGTTLAMLFMLSIAGVYLYVQWQEKKQQQEADRRRREMYARQRAYYENRNRGPAGQERTASGKRSSRAAAAAQRRRRHVGKKQRPGRSFASNSRCANCSWP